MESRKRSGFTLIELLASAVLAAMMTAALLSVVWSSVRETNQLRQAEINRWPVTQLVSQMRRDFLNARGMAVTADGVSLYGFLGHDRRDGSPTLRAGAVRYQPVRAAGRMILVRRASSEDGETSQPVWFGFGTLQIEPLEETDAEDALLHQAVTGGLPPVPGSFRVTMLADNGKVLWREVIHHHAG